MSAKLFLLKDVSTEEADDVRELLESQSIEYFETSAGNWGISVAAIWLYDEDLYPQARALIDDYQQQRQSRAVNKTQSSFFTVLLRDIANSPARFSFFAILSLVILYISIKPFLL